MLPAHQFLPDAGERGRIAKFDESLRRDALGSPRTHVDQDSLLDQRVYKSLRNHVANGSNAHPKSRSIAAEIRMVEETHAVRLELDGELIQIGRQHILVDVNQRIEAEDEVDRVILDHRKRPTI